MNIAGRMPAVKKNSAGERCGRPGDTEDFLRILRCLRDEFPVLFSANQRGRPKPLKPAEEPEERRRIGRRNWAFAGASADADRDASVGGGDVEGLGVVFRVARVEEAGAADAEMLEESGRRQSLVPAEVWVISIAFGP